jgi:large subunit ribosomal protein L9
MDIILKEDILGLGFKNDIVKVKSGYGRNYLIPQGKGIIASENAKKQLAENLKQQASKLAALKAEADKKAAALEGISLEIKVKSTAVGTVYGSVGAAQVSEALKALGHDIDRKIILMKDAKKLGTHIATVVFHKEVRVEIPVNVISDTPIEKKNTVEAPAKAAAPKAEAETEKADVEEEVAPTAE